MSAITDSTSAAFETPPQDTQLIAQNNATRFWDVIPDELGGSDLADLDAAVNNKALARDNITLIKDIVRQQGGDVQALEQALYETLEHMTERGILGEWVGTAFYYGASNVLLEKATSMPADQFIEYLESAVAEDTLMGRVFSETELDRLTEAAQQTTAAYVQQTRGEGSFRLFSAMEGRNGDLAYSAGAADALAEEFFGSGRDLLLIMTNPLEAANSALNLVHNADQLPAAAREAFQQVKAELAKWPESDYNKGYIEAKVLIAALDIADVAEAGTRLNRLVGDIRTGRVTNLGDALDVLDGTAPSNRPSQTPSNATTSPNRPTTTTSAPPAQQATDLARALTGQSDSAFSRELQSQISNWASQQPPGAIDQLRTNPSLLVGDQGNPSDLGLAGEALLRAEVPASHRDAARSVLIDARSNLDDASM
ncbi:MAG: hypothetical protein AAFU65_14675, partial [Pseudomonadota bacterium]